jgi:hypothetical protein
MAKDPISKGFKKLGKELNKYIAKPINDNVGKPMKSGFKKVGSGFKKVGSGFKTFGKILGKGFKTFGKLIVKGFRSLGGFFKIAAKYLLRVFIFMWNIFVWISGWVVCGFNKILKLPECFLWYFLEFIGFVVYLPFRILFALIDYILYPGFNKIVYDFWCFLYRLDGSVKTTTGYSFMHYPDEIIETCYKCKTGSFPKF